MTTTKFCDCCKKKIDKMRIGLLLSIEEIPHYAINRSWTGNYDICNKCKPKLDKVLKTFFQEQSPQEGK